MNREKRASAQPLKVEGADGGSTIVGYAAVFGSPASIGDMWVEVIERGAFTETLASGDDVLALYSHEIDRLLGRSSSGTLRLAQDDKGLAVEIDLPDTSDGRDVAVLVKRGDLKGMSFGFCVTKQEWDETISPPKRTIMAVDLYEVTVTADPAYDDTEVGMRSLEAVRRSRRSQNFSAAAKRVAMKMTVDLRARGMTSKA
ncbi:HK97 family phage prohead protease [Sphingomonas sp. RT2P30]|uniref:HK97 family phage prohead protease n=1 Tax=Parasphingomonas halimpatiens TaxID=3096162 RepID=UPI002FC63066